MYKRAYQFGKKIPKRDRFGLYARVESAMLECCALAIEASLLSKREKILPLKKLRVHISVAQRLVRLCQELGIIDSKKYFQLQEKLIESSKMATGWLAYIERNEPR